MSTPSMQITIRGAAFRAALLAGFAGAALTAAPARAQEEPPSPEEMKQKVIEIEKLMKKAEEALARSVDSKDPEKAAKEMEKIFDEQARKQTGKSGEDLRKEAASGSSEAAEAIRKIMEESKKASAGASEEIKKLLEETKQGGQGASAGIEWLLKQVKSGGGGSGGGSGGGGGGKDPKEKPEEKKPDGDKKDDPKDKKDEQKDKGPKPPESNKERPRNPQFEAWYASLPPQVKQAYDAQDWDSIPPQFRSIVREWTKKMAEEQDKERK